MGLAGARATFGLGSSFSPGRYQGCSYFTSKPPNPEEGIGPIYYRLRLGAHTKKVDRGTKYHAISRFKLLIYRLHIILNFTDATLHTRATAITEGDVLIGHYNQLCFSSALTGPFQGFPYQYLGVSPFTGTTGNSQDLQGNQPPLLILLKKPR